MEFKKNSYGKSWKSHEISFLNLCENPVFVSGADLENLWGDFLHIAHTHPLGGVDVPFEGYDFDLHLLAKIAFKNIFQYC